MAGFALALLAAGCSRARTQGKVRTALAASNEEKDLLESLRAQVAMLQGEMTALKDQRRTLEQEAAQGAAQETDKEPDEEPEAAASASGESAEAVEETVAVAAEDSVELEPSEESVAEEAEEAIAEAATKVEREAPAKPDDGEIPEEVTAAARERVAAAVATAAASEPMEVPATTAPIKASTIAEGAPLQQRVDVLESRVDELTTELERLMEVVMTRTAMLKEAEDTLKSVQIFLAGSRKEHVG